MPPVFGPASPSNARLWSCAGATAPRRDRRTARTARPRGRSGPPRSRTCGRRRRTRRREVRAHRVARLGDRLGDDARPCPRRARRSSRRSSPGSVSRNANAAASSAGAETSRTRAVGTPAATSTSFIHAFEPSRRAAAALGPNARRPARSQRVDDAGDERILGTDDDEIGVELGRRDRRPRPDRSPSTGTHSPIVAMPGLPGRADDLVDVRRARQPPRERVLAPATTDDENAGAHALRGAGQARSSDRARDRHRRSSRARR